VSITVSGSALVERGVAEPIYEAQFLDNHASFGLIDEPDDLFFCISALSHGSHFP
jgi:hypothetical protein